MKKYECVLRVFIFLAQMIALPDSSHPVKIDSRLSTHHSTSTYRSKKKNWCNSKNVFIFQLFSFQFEITVEFLFL
jgi:hypothetical protein